MSNVYQAPQADLTPKPKRANERNPVTQEMIDNVVNGRFWAKFIAVLGYIGAVFMLVVPIFGLISQGIGGRTIAILLIFGLFAFVVFKMSRFLSQYSAAVRALQDSGDIGDMLDAQEYFAKYMKWMGVITLIMMVFVILAIIAAIALPTMLSGMGGI